MILRVDKAQRRISLSLKGATPEASSEASTEEEPEVEAKPRRPRTTPLRGGLGDH
jgi:ribosomal protein S1